jgi:hypothetical protein
LDFHGLIEIAPGLPLVHFRVGLRVGLQRGINRKFYLTLREPRDFYWSML